jgi:uncharacterized protein
LGTVHNVKAGKTAWKVAVRRMTMNMQELVEILACPQCKGPVKLVDEEKGLLCEKCSLLYEIRDGIPVMLISEARKVEK